MRSLPLLLLVGCLHNVEEHYASVDVGDVSYIWQMTEGFRFELTDEVLAYHRIGNTWWRESAAGKESGFYTKSGVKVHRPEGEEVLFYADDGKFSLRIRSEDGCSETYDLNLKDRTESTVTLRGDCSLFRGLEEDLVVGVEFGVMNREDLREVEARYRRLMFTEGEIASQAWWGFYDRP